MKIKALKTHKVTKDDTDIFAILDKYIKSLNEKSVVAVTSKIVAICEGRIVRIGTVNKTDLLKQESEYFLPPEENKYNVSLAIKNNLLVAGAGIDESNGNGYYILWPSDPQKWANKIREYFVERFKLKHVGVIITDSKTTPLRWGVTGACIAHSGFQLLKDYRGKPDIFGRHLVFQTQNIGDGLAAAATLEMGEGDEQQPLAIIEDVPFVEFQKRNPTQEELEALKINIDDDLYSSLLKNAPWRKGKK